MRKSLTLILSAGVLTLPGLAKIPEQGALFSLTRVVDGKERELTRGEELGAGSRLRLHLLAIHQPCTVLANAFQRGKARAVDSLGPTVTRLVADEEGTVEFSLKSPIKAAELFIVVVPQQSRADQDLTQLVKVWKANPQDSKGPRTALHDRYSDWLAKRDKTLTYAGPLPKELGGVRTTSAQSVNPSTAVREETGGNESLGKATARDAFPVTPYPWRNQANWLPCSTAQPGVFVYQLGK